MGDALRGEDAQLLEFLAGQAARAVLGQHRDRDVVALERLQQGVAHDPQLQVLRRAAVGLAQAAGARFGRQQPVLQQPVDAAVDRGQEAVVVPGQEQLGLEERPDGQRDAADVLRRHPLRVEEAARHHRRDRGQVRDVVAEVGQQHGLLGPDADDVAQRVSDRLDHAQLDAVGDDLLRRLAGEGDALGVAARLQQVEVQRQLRQQLVAAQREPARGQEDHRQQVDRVDVGGLVDARHDAQAEVVHQRRQPARLLVRQRVALAPAG